ncbi:MAG: NUDIX hydrolase [Thermoactinospora sp.]|nr:NUDIX hydrolase [Thermoactinospora sp.]
MDNYWQSVYRVLAGSGAYITDPDGRVLLVNPNYRDHWLFPGGGIDEGEEPARGCVREVREELGLELEAGQLLVVQWNDALPPRPYPLVHFLFDCGTLPADTPIALQEAELDEYGFFSVDQARELLPAPAHARLVLAAEARDSGTTRYLLNGG